MSRLPLARVTHRKCQIAANFLVLQRAEAADNRDREGRWAAVVGWNLGLALTRDWSRLRLFYPFGRLKNPP